MTELDEAYIGTPYTEKTVAGQPSGLFYLFATEFWERFSYYGMRSLLVLYIIDTFFQNVDVSERKTIAYGIFGAYGALVYATPVIGGVIADKFIGYRKAITLGAVLMAIGHLLMAFKGEMMFYAALGLLIVGNGFFKPNISALVGSLYPEGDTRRESGFTIFYMGVNLGAFFSPLVCGWLGMEYGWHYGFGSAGIGMLIGLIIFLIGTKKNVLGNYGFQPKQYVKHKFLGIPTKEFIYLLSVIAIPLFAFLVKWNEYNIGPIGMMTFILTSVGIIVLAKLGYHMFEEDKAGAQKIFVVILLTFFAMVFWSFFEQAGTSLTMFADENVNLPSWCNAAQAQSINPLVIILFAFPFAAMWPALAKRELNPNTIVKCFIGLFLLGLGFIVFAYSANYVDNITGKVPFLFLALGYFILTIGELSMSPIILSKVTELSPTKVVSFMLGASMLSSSFAHHLGGIIAKYTVPSADNGLSNQGFLAELASGITGFDNSIINKGEGGIDTLASSTIVFAQIGVASIIVSLFILALSPLIRKLMNNVH